jgi:hypothetical protein
MQDKLRIFLSLGVGGQPVPRKPVREGRLEGGRNNQMLIHCGYVACNFALVRGNTIATCTSTNANSLKNPGTAGSAAGQRPIRST